MTYNHKNKSVEGVGVVKMAQYAKVLVIKHKNLSSTHVIHSVEGATHERAHTHTLFIEFLLREGPLIRNPTAGHIKCWHTDLRTIRK